LFGKVNSDAKCKTFQDDLVSLDGVPLQSATTEEQNVVCVA